MVQEGAESSPRFADRKTMRLSYAVFAFGVAVPTVWREIQLIYVDDTSYPLVPNRMINQLVGQAQIDSHDVFEGILHRERESLRALHDNKKFIVCITVFSLLEALG
jgi:hypothetical protein